MFGGYAVIQLIWWLLVIDSNPKMSLADVATPIKIFLSTRFCTRILKEDERRDGPESGRLLGARAQTNCPREAECYTKFFFDFPHWSRPQEDLTTNTMLRLYTGGANVLNIRSMLNEHSLGLYTGLTCLTWCAWPVYTKSQFIEQERYM